MAPLTLTLDIPQHVIDGLLNETYERVGAVIRDASTKQVVMWLRELPGGNAQTLIPSVLSSLMPALASLNVAISAAGFAVTIEKLMQVEQHLKDVQVAIELQGRKLDLTFQAKAYAALELARNAISLASKTSREASAYHAIAKLVEARHQQLGLLDIELDARSQAVDEYFAAVALLAAAEARCYLELEELEAARNVLVQTAYVLRGRVERHVATLLTEHPAIYLHPALGERISLRRLARTHRWLRRCEDEADFFEQHRADIFSLSQKTSEWLAALPPAVQEAEPSQGWIEFIAAGPARIAGALWNLLPGTTPTPQPTPFDRLAIAMDTIEGLIEDMDRFETYALEVRAMQQLGVSFAEWQQLKLKTLPKTHKSAADTSEALSGMAYVVFAEPLTVS